MSSTNRGYERHKADYYVTPRECISDFFVSWFLDLQAEENYNFVCERPDKVKWLDPCAGGSKEDKRMSYKDFIEDEFQPPIINTIDVREDSPAFTKADYLTHEVEKDYYDVIITNPPFHIAREIIEKALSDVKEGGYVVMLLRLNFFGSKQRKEFFKNHMPKWSYIHHRRMSFTPDKKTDSIEYMHAVWHKGETIKKTLTTII